MKWNSDVWGTNSFDSGKSYGKSKEGCNLTENIQWETRTFHILLATLTTCILEHFSHFWLHFSGKFMGYAETSDNPVETESQETLFFQVFQFPSSLLITQFFANDLFLKGLYSPKSDYTFIKIFWAMLLANLNSLLTFQKCQFYCGRVYHSSRIISNFYHSIWITSIISYVFISL